MRTRSPSGTKVSSSRVITTLIVAAGAQFGRQGPGEIEHEILFDRAIAAHGAGIDAAMAGIEHDDRLVRGGAGGAPRAHRRGLPGAWAGLSAAPRRAARALKAASARRQARMTRRARLLGGRLAQTARRQSRPAPARSTTMRDLPGASRPKRKEAITPDSGRLRRLRGDARRAGLRRRLACRRRVDLEIDFRQVDDGAGGRGEHIGSAVTQALQSEASRVSRPRPAEPDGAGMATGVAAVAQARASAGAGDERRARRPSAAGASGQASASRALMFSCAAIDMCPLRACHRGDPSQSHESVKDCLPG